MEGVQGTDWVENKMLQTHLLLSLSKFGRGVCIWVALEVLIGEVMVMVKSKITKY